MPVCPCGNEFSQARAQLDFAICLECGKREADAEIARRAHMIAPISHKSGYTYLGPDRATQIERLREGSAKTPPLQTGAPVFRRTDQPSEAKRRRYEFAGWEFKPDKRGVRQKRAILREVSSD